MRITACSIKDFKRVRDVAIKPDADRTLILIGGKNAQGKSSILDALTAAFGGKKSQPVDAVRHGAEAATIEVELDGGELTVRRDIQPSGESVLEVRDRYGAVKSPQAILDKLVGARFLDPLAFLNLPAKEQRAALMRLIDGADRIAGLNEKRGRAFERRTEVGRDLTKAEGELARLPEVKPDAPIDVAALNDEKAKYAAVQRECDTLGNRKAMASKEASAAQLLVEKTKAEIADLERKLAVARDLHLRDESVLAAAIVIEEESRCAYANAADSWEKFAARRAEIDAELSRATEHNRSVFAAESQSKRRTEVAADVEKLTKEREDLTKVIDTIDERKAKVLAEAKLPVENLGVTDDGIELGGVPFSQASGAEKLRVSLAIAIAASPKLADVWIRDGALLDEESLELVSKYAETNGKRVWVERVGTRDPGVIVIQDGQVAS